MKWIKLYKSFGDIDSICRKYGIKNYTINEDGTVDVDSGINLYSRGLTKLPLKFGNVSGEFHCSYNKLETLEGCPNSVGGGFYCANNRLISLEFCPQSVGGDFYCGNNQLISLEGGPKSVGGDFYCNNNKLTTLEFCPQSIGRDFSCSENKLKDLYGFPEFFDNNIYHSNTNSFTGFNFSTNPVSEILYLFKTKRLGKVIDLLNEYGVIQQDGKVVILDRLEEVFHTLNMEIPKINLKNYEVY